jgi:hypothetical protein
MRLVVVVVRILPEQQDVYMVKGGDFECVENLVFRGEDGILTALFFKELLQLLVIWLMDLIAKYGQPTGRDRRSHG